MALDAHILAEDQAACVKPWLASIGVACEVWDAADQAGCPSEHVRTWHLRSGDTLFVCRRGDAEVWMEGKLLPTYGSGGHVAEWTYVLAHLHLKRRCTGRGFRQSFRDERLRKDVRKLLKRNEAWRQVR